MELKYKLSEDKKSIKFDEISVDSLTRDEAFEIVFASEENAKFLIEECIWRAKKLSDKYIANNTLEKISPVMFNYRFNIFLIDIGFFMETIGEYIKEEIGVDFTNEFYNLSASSLLKDGYIKEIIKYIVGAFEIRHGLLSQNEFSSFSVKARKVEHQFHFYKRNVIGIPTKIDSGDKEFEKKTICSYIEISRDIVEKIVDSTILNSYFNNFAQIRYRVVNQTIASYRKEITKLDIVENRTYYLKNTYKK